MEKTCPSCNFVRKDGDFLDIPEWKCPKCDVVYEKFKKSIKPKKTIENNMNIKTNDNPFLSKKGIIILVSVFIVGFFSGREYFRYEARKTIENAFQGFSNAFSKNTKEETTNIFSSKTTLPVKIIRKNYREFDSGIGNDAVTFSLDIGNTFDKDIRAFNGTVVFTDILDNEIKKLNLAYKHGIKSHSSSVWGGEMSYNQFIESDRKLKNIELRNLKVSIILKKVLFTDGSSEEY